MSTEFIIGTVLTIVFGLGSLIQSYKGSPTRLIFVVDELINLYADITRNINGMEVIYKGEQVKENLYLIKAYIFCFGNKDIIKDHAAKTLYVELKNDSVWKDCQIIGKTNDLDVVIRQDKNKIIFDFDLLKNGDFFSFQSLCEIKEKKPTPDKIFNVNHRIANLGKIQSLNSKEDIVPMYAVILAWLSTFAISAFLLLPTLKIDNYEKSNFKNNYYLNGKPFNLDSIKTPIQKKLDSVNTLMMRDINTSIKMYDKLSAYYDMGSNPLNNRTYNRISKSVDSLSVINKKREKLILGLKERIKIVEGKFPKSDSLFNKIIDEHSYLYFFVNKTTKPLSLDSSSSVSYTLVENTGLYFAMAGVLFVTILCIGSISLTRNYLKYKSILAEINKIRRNSEGERIQIDS